MTNVSERTAACPATQISGNGGYIPPTFPVAAGDDGRDDGEAWYDFIFVDGQFHAVPTKN